MQLNKTNGNIVIIKDYIKKTGKVVFTEYENILFNNDGTIKKEFISEYQNTKILNVDYSNLSDGSLTDEENILKRFYEALKLELGDEYVISYDVQNWLFNTKPIRVIINNIKNNKQLVINSAYKALMDKMIATHEGFIDVGEINTVMYVNTLVPTEMAVVLDFLDVWIFTENKL